MIHPKLVSEFIANKLPLYSCIWLPPDYEVIHKFETLLDFNEDKGYSSEDIHNISNLAVGECTTFGTFHFVTRIS